MEHSPAWHMCPLSNPILQCIINMSTQHSLETLHENKPISSVSVTVLSSSLWIEFIIAEVFHLLVIIITRKNGVCPFQLRLDKWLSKFHPTPSQTSTTSVRYKISPENWWFSYGRVESIHIFVHKLTWHAIHPHDSVSHLASPSTPICHQPRFPVIKKTHETQTGTLLQHPQQSTCFFHNPTFVSWAMVLISGTQGLQNDHRMRKALKTTQDVLYKNSEHSAAGNAVIRGPWSPQVYYWLIKRLQCNVQWFHLSLCMSILGWRRRVLYPTLQWASMVVECRIHDYWYFTHLFWVQCSELTILYLCVVLEEIVWYDRYMWREWDFLGAHKRKTSCLFECDEYRHLYWLILFRISPNMNLVVPKQWGKSNPGCTYVTGVAAMFTTLCRIAREITPGRVVFWPC